MNLLEDEAFLQEHFCKGISVKQCLQMTKTLKMAIVKGLVRVYIHMQNKKEDTIDR